MELIVLLTNNFGDSAVCLCTWPNRNQLICFVYELKHYTFCVVSYYIRLRSFTTVGVRRVDYFVIK